MNWEKFKPKKLFKAKVPDIKEYIGRSVDINGEIVTIETIVGNIAKPTFYEINGEYLIGMLRFHAQMNGDHSITEQEFLDFEALEFEVEKMPDPADKKSVLEMPYLNKEVKNEEPKEERLDRGSNENSGDDASSGNDGSGTEG